MENIIINIDSRFRDRTAYPNSAFFVYRLKDVLKNCNYIRLSSFEIPNLYFTFSERKKNLSFKITILSVEYTVTIGPGMYNYEQLLVIIQNAIDSIISSQSLTVSIELSFTSITGFVTINSDTNFSINFDNNDPYLKPLGYYLGFRKNTYTAQTKVVNNATVYYIVSESQLDTTGDHYMFLRINDYGVIHHDFDSITNTYQISDSMKTPGRKNLLAKIIINEQKTEHVFDNGSNFLSKSYIFKQPIDISRLEIELIEPSGFTIDLLYMDFSFTLEVGIITNSNLRDQLTNDMFNTHSITGPMFNPSIENVFNNHPNNNFNNFNNINGFRYY
jgi:hypothetical protein